MIVKIHFSLIILCAYLCIIQRIDIFILFYIFVILHELAHVVAAIILNVKIEEIVLLSVGVNAKYNNNINCNKELIIASAGPLMSLILAFIFRSNIFCAINIIILITNIMPIYPLDGGRIIRIILIKLYGYKNGINIYGKCLMFLICVFTVISIITIVYFKNYYLILFCGYVFLLANREIKKERVKLIINELIGVQL